MNVNELRIGGSFEIPNVEVDEEFTLEIRLRVYSIERQRIDVSGFDPEGKGETVPGDLYVQALAVSEWPKPLEAPTPIPPDYADSAE